MRSILLALMFMPLLGFAQEKKVYKEYCFVTTARDNAEILLGSSDKSEYITDSIGNKIIFNNKVDIMNYMSRNGWDLFDMKPPTNGRIYDILIFYRIKEEERE